jgi:hypothetical protein
LIEAARAQRSPGKGPGRSALSVKAITWRRRWASAAREPSLRPKIADSVWLFEKKSYEIPTTEM